MSDRIATDLRRGPRAGALLAAVALACAAALAARADETPPAAAPETPAAATELARLRAVERIIVDVAARTAPAMVFLGGGSGVCIEPSGLILTNDHVVGNAKEMLARFAHTGLRRKAKLLGRFPDGDIALLQLDGEGPYPALPLGDSDALVPGENVLALGNPFLLARDNSYFRGAPANFLPSVSLGVVSAVHRYSPPRYPDAIQVDVAVNPGNSGGPLINSNAEVVGINGKIETRLHISVNSGVGYAIPSNQIRRFIEPLRGAEGRAIKHGLIRGVEVEDRIASEKRGLVVRRVIAGSVAAEIGLAAGDEILRIDDYRIPTRPRFEGILQTYPIGHQITIHYVRDGEEKQLLATLADPDYRDADGKEAPVRLGVTFDPEAQAAQRLDVSQVAAGSPAAVAGIKVGDRIMAFEGAEVASFTELKVRLEAKRLGDTVTIKIVRGEETLELPVHLVPFRTD